MTSRKTKSSFGGDSRQSRSSITGASASKLPRCTPLQHSSRKILGSQSKSVSKKSHFGSSDYHIQKDTRPLSDKGYMRKCINELIAFLSEMNYPYPLTVKMMSPPTNKEYFRIVEFVYGLLTSPKYKMMVRPEEETFKILMDLNYPFTIAKSTLNNIGTMSAWPHALGAVDWLVDLVKYNMALEENELELNEMLYCGDKKKEAFHDYLQATYVAFMRGQNPPFTEIDAALSSELEAMNKDVVAEVNKMKTELQQQENEKASLLAEKATLIGLEQDVRDSTKMKKDLEDYFEELDKYCATLQEQCNAREAKLHEMEQTATQLEQSNKELQSTITGQELSVADVQNMKIQVDQIKNAIETMNARCKQLQEQYFEKQISQSKLIDQINSQIVEYTNTCTELELIPPTAANAEGIDYSLSSDRSQLDKNEEKLLTLIRPKIISLKSLLLKDYGKLQQKRNHNATTIEQLKEEVSDKKREADGLRQQLDKLNEEVDQKKAEYDGVEEKERHNIESLTEDIQQLKSINSLSKNELEEIRVEHKIEREKLKEMEVCFAREKDELCDSLNTVCKSCIEYKVKAEKIMTEFNNNIKDMNKKYLSKFQEVCHDIEESSLKLDDLGVEVNEALSKMDDQSD